MFWVDEIVEDILKKQNKDEYLITDWKTPSGHIHIGALRGVIIHELVRHALADKGKKALFQYGFDDYDPMDGFPVYLDPSFKKYMGMPLSNIPAPDGKSASYADQYANEFIEVIKGLGYNVKFVKTSEMYKVGFFDEAIKITLDHADEIRKIYFEVSGAKKDQDWYPLNVICPVCGKTGSTKVIGWDSKKVRFQCLPNQVEWAKGCGYEGEIEPFKGNAKLPWKVEWPAKFYLFKMDIEGEGKDHATKGGSREIADTICRQVYKHTPPYDIPYEWILISGAKMSSSKGVGATAKNVYVFLPSNILRFLFTKTKYRRTADFNPEGDTILTLYDDYDRVLAAYHADPKSDLARAFYFAEIGIEKELPNYVLRFSKIANMLQMPRADIFKYAEEEKGNKLTDIEIEEIKHRISVAKEWLNKFAPEEMKFVVQETMPQVKINDNQKLFLKKLLDRLQSLEKWDGQEIHTLIHDVKNELSINPKEAFSALYRVFLNKDYGPQAGWFLGALDKNFILNRLKEV